MRLRKSRLFACLSAVVAVVAAPATVLVSAAFAATDPAPVPVLAQVSVVAPSSVTRGTTATVAAHLAVESLALSGRTMQFVERPVGSSTWTSFATAATDARGWASARTAAFTTPVEIGAYYSDASGAVRSNVDSSVVHVIDPAPSAPRAAMADATVTIRGVLVEDRVHTLGAQPVKLWVRIPSAHRWSAPLSLTTNARGVAVFAKKFTHTTTVAIRFPGANGYAASPLAITTVVVKHARVHMSGFVFPFAVASQAESVGAWTLDQGVDIAARGYACGASAILVAIGDGVVIQEGISGFGPTAPVIRMTSGPLAGRNVYYGHTGHVYVAVGAHVRAGQRLAQIGCGSVGYSDMPHVEIGVGLPGGPPCCPAFHQTASTMYRLLLAALRG